MFVGFSEIFSTAEVMVISVAAVPDVSMLEAVAVEVDGLWPGVFSLAMAVGVEARMR